MIQLAGSDSWTDLFRRPYCEAKRDVTLLQRTHVVIKQDQHSNTRTNPFHWQSETRPILKNRYAPKRPSRGFRKLRGLLLLFLIFALTNFFLNSQKSTESWRLSSWELLRSNNLHNNAYVTMLCDDVMVSPSLLIYLFTPEAFSKSPPLARCSCSPHSLHTGG